MKKIRLILIISLFLLSCTESNHRKCKYKAKPINPKSIKFNQLHKSAADSIRSNSNEKI